MPQKEVNFEFVQSSYGAGGGLIGAIVDLSVNAAMSSSAETRAKKLRPEIQDFDFAARYWQAITNPVHAAQWLNLQSCSLSASNVPPMKKTMLANGSVINIGSSYAITPDCRVFKVLTGMDIYVPGKTRPAATLMLQYHSAEIGDVEGDKALVLWTENRGEKYRRFATEGIEESAKLVRYGLEVMGAVPSGTPRLAKIKAKLVHGRAGFGIPIGKAGLKGLVLEETEDRVIFQVEKGGLFSFARKDVDVEFITLKK